jgi:lamin tail-like protein
MKLLFRIVMLLLLNFIFHSLQPDIVINEVLYDPSGSDGGYEWIELYNSGEGAVDLTGWIIRKAGTEFSDLLILPDCTLESQGHLLIGDEYVINADLTAELSFQNGGSATDGIQIVSPDGLYTDTVLYDEPNSNFLPDDLSDPGQFFAPDVSGGHSLSRISDGVDSDNCQTDWFDCEIPTPGAPNFYPIDLEISYVNIVQNGANYEAFIGVKNLSTVAVDNYASNLEIAVNNSFLTDLALPGINGADSLEIAVELGLYESGYYVTQILLNCIYDIVLDNNYGFSSFLSGNSPVVTNEIMFKPDDYSFEWIELYNTSLCGYDVDNFGIIDASGAKILFSGYIESGDYLVVAENRDQLLIKYPETEADKVVQSDDWTSLNNTEESLILMDQFGTEFERMEYDGSDCSEDMSLERINPYIEPQPDNWGFSIDKATPGNRNSIFVIDLPTKAKLAINPDTFSPFRGERTIISYKLPEKLSRVTVRIFDLKGRMKRKLLDQQIQAAEGEFIWDGRSSLNKILPIGIYIILMEATSLETEKVYSQTGTAIIGK